MKSYRDIVGDGGSNIAGQVAEQRRRVDTRLSSVRHIVAVMSGKGGVGKSSITAGVASALALEGHAVGILDSDINGSSIPTMTGVRGRAMRRDGDAMVPPVSVMNVKVVSIDLLLADDRTAVTWNAPTQRDAHTWRAMMEVGAIREFLADTEWGPLDFLLVDFPPGTDKLSNVVGALPRLSGVVVVTIPSGASSFVVRKSIHMAREMRTPMIGMVENMSVYACPHCGGEEALFGGVDGAAMAAAHDIPFLGRVPFDPAIPALVDEGRPYMRDHGDRPAARAMRSIAGKIRDALDGRPVDGGDR